MRVYFSERLPRDEEECRDVLTQAGIAPLCLARQVHGTTILYADEHYISAEGDALFTDRPGLFVGVKTADCVPVLLHSPAAVAAVHAGWRGTASKLAAETVRLLCERYGLTPDRITARIGPCICQRCFETGPEVPAALGPEAQDLVARRGDKYHPDLRRINALWLRSAGITEIEVSEECTRCRPDRYWSHRAHGSERGVQISALAL